MKYPDRYIHLLEQHGVKLEQLGLDDAALESKHALAAVTIFLEERLSILGGDVFFKEKDKIRLAYANWYANKLTDEDDLAYMERSCQVAADYIKKFPKKEGFVPLFSFVVSDARSAV